MRENKFRKALNRAGPIFGMGAAIPSLVEIIGHWGFDYVFVDSEHATLNVDFHLEELVEGRRRRRHSGGVPRERPRQASRAQCA
jgi:2-keto-3-deoxy-L-rhamnonate aldolase RhmA